MLKITYLWYSNFDEYFITKPIDISKANWKIFPDIFQNIICFSINLMLEIAVFIWVLNTANALKRSFKTEVLTTTTRMSMSWGWCHTGRGGDGYQGICRDVARGGGGWGGWSPPPEFGRSVNTIKIRGGRLCPSHYCQPPWIPNSIYISDLYVVLDKVIMKCDSLPVAQMSYECTYFDEINDEIWFSSGVLWAWFFKSHKFFCILIN